MAYYQVTVYELFDGRVQFKKGRGILGMCRGYSMNTDIVFGIFVLGWFYQRVKPLGYNVSIDTNVSIN
jgi:hypothetical protein